MAEAAREAWITGIGIISCLGEGPQAHWQKLMDGSAERRHHRPLRRSSCIRLAPINFDAQIPKKGDQRQMEAWQRIGTYAAGLALDSAGVKGKPEILSHMDMIVAASGGERDLAVDATILSGMPHAQNPAAFLNERLMSDLRPTLFLAQLSNLLAGNISIVHGVTGSSRTFMGEESAGVDAVRIAVSRINAGQSDIALVGGAYNGERPDLLMLYEFGQIAHEGALCAGLAARRQRRLCAWLARRVPGDRSARACREARRQAAGAADGGRFRSLQPQARRGHGATLSRACGTRSRTRCKPGHAAVISGATGAQPATERGTRFSAQPWRPCRARHRFLSRPWA